MNIIKKTTFIHIHNYSKGKTNSYLDYEFSEFRLRGIIFKMSPWVMINMISTDTWVWWRFYPTLFKQNCLLNVTFWRTWRPSLLLWSGQNRMLHSYWLIITFSRQNFVTTLGALYHLWQGAPTVFDPHFSIVRISKPFELQL